LRRARDSTGHGVSRNLPSRMNQGVSASTRSSKTWRPLGRLVAS